jgi:non-canonical (house-cleaning) NTP pyrophosphatase
MLHVHIGTTNEAKTRAIRNVFEAYRLLPLTTASKLSPTGKMVILTVFVDE